MSLSFVSKTVQTSTSDGGFEEKAIESADGADDTSSKTAQKPLFEQLRHNKDQNDEEREEYQRTLMRGTLALDEEDCAHFSALERQKSEKESRVHQETQDGLAAFRAAQADRLEQQVVIEASIDEQEDSNESVAVGVAVKPPAPVVTAPKLIFKKRRRKQEEETAASGSAQEKKGKITGESKNETNANTPIEEKQKESSNGVGLGSLLTGYGSSSDDD
jgi:hypothetical protein